MAVVAVVVGIGLVLFIAILPVAVRTAPAVTARHIKTVSRGDKLLMTIQISNHTAHAFIFYPTKLEARAGTGWNTISEFTDRSLMGRLAPYSFTNYICETLSTPAGSSLRLRIYAQEVLTGPKGFLRRIQLRTAGRTPSQVPLNPYDKQSWVYGKASEVVTEEFVQHEPAQNR